MSVFHAEKRLKHTVLWVMVLIAIPTMNNDTILTSKENTPQH